MFTKAGVGETLSPDLVELTALRNSGSTSCLKVNMDMELGREVSVGAGLTVSPSDGRAGSHVGVDEPSCGWASVARKREFMRDGGSEGAA